VRLNAFFMNPDLEMDEAQLTAKERTALLSRDPDQIRGAMAGTFAKDTTVVVLVAAPQVQ
jgi:hypothetical protein